MTPFALILNFKLFWSVEACGRQLEVQALKEERSQDWKHNFRNHLQKGKRVEISSAKESTKRVR